MRSFPSPSPRWGGPGWGPRAVTRYLEGNVVNYLILAVVALAGIASVASAGVSPGRIGAYVRLSEAVKSPAKLREEMKRIKATGIDFIIPDAKGTSGKLNWDSSVAPKDMIANPDFMAMVVKYAHSVGLKVYPCFCVCPEGGDGRLDPMLERNPSWAWFYNGARRGYIDPGNADARHYETSLIAELVSKYDVDGLSLDYLRCPGRVGYTDSGRDFILKKHNVDLANVVGTAPIALDTEGGKKAAAAVNAAALKNPIWPEWKKWRTEQVNTLMREIRAAVNKAKPGLPISSYVWGYNTYSGNYETNQDWMTWISKGWLDWINPSGYRYTDDAFIKAVTDNRAHIPKNFPFYVTIGVLTSHGKLNNAAEVRKQMAISREHGADGLVFFTWESLKPFADELAPNIKSFGQ